FLFTTIVGKPVPYVATVSVPSWTRVGGAALRPELAAPEPAIAIAPVRAAAIVTNISLMSCLLIVVAAGTTGRRRPVCERGAGIMLTTSTGCIAPEAVAREQGAHPSPGWVAAGLDRRQRRPTRQPRCR